MWVALPKIKRQLQQKVLDLIRSGGFTFLGVTVPVSASICFSTWILSYDSNRTQAQALLAHYHQLTDDQKQGMVKKYQDKNLNWTTEYLEKSENTKSTVQEWETGYYNVADIFKLNGLEYFQVPEAERKQLLDAFLDESKKHVT